MTIPYAVNGVPLDQILEPYSGGPKASATGYKVNGVDLRDLFDPISLGSAPATTGYKVRGVDLAAIFSAKGSVSHALGFDGGTYQATSVSRGSGWLRLSMDSSGTWSISRQAPSTAVITSGTWLPSGESAGNWSCQFTYAVGMDDTIGSGDNSVTNGASSNSALSTTRTLDVISNAHLTGSRAEQIITLTVKLYRSGVLRSTSVCTFHTSANGN